MKHVVTLAACTWLRREDDMDAVTGFDAQESVRYVGDVIPGVGRLMS